MNNQAIDLSNIQTDKVYVAGEWLASSDDGKIQIVSPDTEEVFASVTAGTRGDMDRAVAAARKAFDTGEWPLLQPSQRAEWIARLSAAIVSRKSDIAFVWSKQIGVPFHLSTRMTGFMAPTLDNYVGLVDDVPFLEEKPMPGAGVGLLAQEPVGVVAAIAPWNVPLSTMLNKIGPALLAGCTVIMKPSPETPLEAYIIAQCADEIGFPAGVINLVCAQRDVSEYLVRQPGVDKVSFTGSVPAGQKIASICAERVARCTLELGGKSAAIILDDFDLDVAAQQLVSHICGLSGQNCALLSRILISRSRQGELLQKMKAHAEAVKVGPAFDESSTMGPIAMKRQLGRIEAMVAKGVEDGAILEMGGRRPPHLERGYFYEPTILSNVDNSMAIAQEEIFGPVACVIAYDSIEEAIAIANDSDFGLAGAVYTNSADEAYSIARRIRTGTVGQNGPKANFSIGFGGFKKSGIGREGGLQGIKSYLEAKTILLDSAPQILG